MGTRNILGLIAGVIILTGIAIFFGKGRKEEPRKLKEEQIFKKFISSF